MLISSTEASNEPLGNVTRQLKRECVGFLAAS